MTHGPIPHGPPPPHAQPATWRADAPAAGSGRSHVLPWLALALGIASPAVTLASFLGGLVGLSAVVGVPDVSTLLAWASGLAAVVLGIVALVRRQAPTFAAVAGIALPIVGHAVLLGAWVLLVVGVMSVAGLG